MEHSHIELSVLLGAVFGSADDNQTGTSGICGVEKIEAMMRSIADLSLFKDNPLLVDESQDMISNSVLSQIINRNK